MKKKIKEDLRNKIANADEKIEKEIKWWGNVSPAIKGIFICIVLLMFLLVLPAEIKISIALIGAWLRVLAMTGIIQICLVEILVLVVLYEIKENGMLSTISKILFIVLAMKFTAEFVGVDTKAIDTILKWIAEVPNIIAKDLIPWIKFW